MQRSSLVAPALTFLALTFATREAAAVEDPPPPAPALRIALDLGFGIDHFHRTKTGPLTENGASLGADLRLHPTPLHGFLFGFTQAGGAFGPSLTTIDAAYSLRILGPRRTGGVTGDLVFDVGPSFGHVHVHDEADHEVFGGRVSVSSHLYLGAFTLGGFVVYRGGIPIGPPDAYEGAVAGGLTLGFVVDTGTR